MVIPSDMSFDPMMYLAQGDEHVDSVISPHSVISPQYLEVTIKASKMDPLCQGMSVLLGAT